MERRNYNSTFNNLYKLGLNVAYSDKIAIFILLIARMEELFEPFMNSVCQFYEESYNKYTHEDLEEKIFDMTDGLPFFRTSRSSFHDLLTQKEIGISDINNYLYGFDSKTADELFKFGALDILMLSVQETRFKSGFLKYYQSVRHEISPDKWHCHLIEVLQGSILWCDWARSYGSNNVLIEVMSSVVASRVDSEVQDIYDPACGFGGSLRSLQHWLKFVSNVKQVNIYGQDKSSAHFASLVTKVVLCKHVNICSADSMQSDSYPDKLYDLIVSDLPLRSIAPNVGFTNPLKGADPSKDATPFLIRHIVDKLKPRGRAVFTLASSTFTLKSNSDYILSLIDQDLIDTILLLPEGFCRDSSVSPCLCIMDKNKPSAHTGKIQVIDFCKLLADTDGFYDELGKNTIFQLHETMRKYENDTYSRIIDNRAMFQYDVAIKSPDGRTILNVVVPGDENDAIQYINYHYLTHMSSGEIDYSSITRCCGIDFGKLFAEEIDEPSFEEMERETEDVMRKVNSAFRKLLNEEIGSMMVSESEPCYKCMLMDVADITRYKSPITYRERLTFENIGANDILVYNSKKGLVGKVARGGEEIISKNAFCLKANEHKVLPDYLYYLIKSKEEEIADMAKGSTLPSISASDLKALKIDLPSLYEQSKIVDQLKERIDAVQELLPMLGGKAKETVEKYAAALIKETLSIK